MIRKVIKIDEELCNGCGLCVNACHEGAIGLEGGKAKLLRDDYCDGLGNCLPVCPTGAITFEEREADAYDQAAVDAAKQKAEQPASAQPQHPHGGCPGSRSMSIERSAPNTPAATAAPAQEVPSQLGQWPVQIKLVPVNAPYFNGANLLIAADCAAYAYGNFHSQFMKNKVTIIGCPKLDEGDYAEKLTAILANNNIKSLTVVRMEVPCCGGIAHAAQTALQRSGKFIPWQIITLTTDGNIVEN